MKSAIAIFGAALTIVVGCGGNVVVDHGSNGSGNGGGTGGTGGTTATTNPATSTVSSSTTTTNTTATTGTVTPGCNTCSAIESGADPSAVCPNAAPAYDELLGCSCAIDSKCADVCGGSFCILQGPSDPCIGCQKTNCAGPLMTCLAI